ncbi:MAG: phosphatidylglycerophosphatase A [Prevotellaceae bacterium]|nr:phosphatidylglycerophosphatase A [Prevotellaceae bacterium]
MKLLLHKIIATGFGAGFCPVAPGTAGSLLAVAIWYVLSLFFPFDTLLLITGVLILVFTAVGIWSASAVVPIWGEDPKKVVVDEMVGMWITLLGVVEGNLWYVLAAFILFRLFDIYKPAGIRKAEQLPSGFGIMFDDVFAGLYGLFILLLARVFGL